MSELQPLSVYRRPWGKSNIGTTYKERVDTTTIDSVETAEQTARTLTAMLGNKYEFTFTDENGKEGRLKKLILSGQEYIELERFVLNGLATDGAFHKQWALHQIAKLLRINYDPNDYEEGIPG